MDNVQIFRGQTVDQFAPGSFRNGGIGTQRNWKFAVVEEVAVFGSVNEVAIVTKSATPCQAVQFLGGEMIFGIRSVGGITGANRRGGRALVM